MRTFLSRISDPSEAGGDIGEAGSAIREPLSECGEFPLLRGGNRLPRMGLPKMVPRVARAVAPQPLTQRNSTSRVASGGSKRVTCPVHRASVAILRLAGG